MGYWQSLGASKRTRKLSAVSDLIGWAIGGLAALLAVIVGVWRTYAAGKSAGKDEVKRVQSENQQEAAREARKIEDDSRTLSDADVIERMRERSKR